MQITKEINSNIFREYDLRGVYGQDLTEDVAYTLGKSFGSYIQGFGETETLVGHDNRLSSPTLSRGFIQGVVDSGMNIIDLGIVTTPMYYYARKHLKKNTGVMITASHNPKDQNGFKIAFSDIGNAYGKLIYDFRDYTFAGDFKEGSGRIINFNIYNLYVEYLKKSIHLGPYKRKIAVDCGNGTGSIIINDVLKALNVDYVPLFCESDGTFPNHPSDPAVPENMVTLSDTVKEMKLDFGFGIDGDADRVGVVDENGTILSADLYMLMIYRNIVKNMHNKKALFDVKCSKTLIDGVKELGLEPVMYRTGNSYTNMMMQEGDFDFGGEYSGHVFFRDRFLGFDDGIYAGLRLLEILTNIEEPMSALLENISHYESTPEIKIRTTDEKKFDIVTGIKNYAIDKGYSIIDIDGVRVNFEDSWALVRASNTGPDLTVRFEATTKERLEELQTEFTDILNGLL